MAAVALQVMNHAGVRTECVWMNFPADRLHWARYAGRNEPPAHQAQGRELGPALRRAAGGRAPGLGAMMAVEAQR